MTEALTPEEEHRIHEAFEHVPFAHLLNLELGEIAPGAATIHIEVRDELRQNRGVVHGGVIASLIDTAAAFALLTLLKRDQTSTTVDLTIHYLRPLLEGRVTAEARVIRAGRRLAVIGVDVLDDTQTVVATALTSFLKLP